MRHGLHLERNLRTAQHPPAASRHFRGTATRSWISGRKVIHSLSKFQEIPNPTASKTSPDQTTGVPRRQLTQRESQMFLIRGSLCEQAYQ